MALLKVLTGKEEHMPTDKNEGYLYFTQDTNNFYIDHKTVNGDIARSLGGVGKRNV